MQPVEDRVHTVRLFGKQDDFVHLPGPFGAFIGGVGSGKTQGGEAKMEKKVSQYPGILGMVTAPTYRMLNDSTLRTVLESLPEGSYEFLRGDMSLKLANGSEVLFRSTEDPDHLRGPNLGFFWMDEAAQSKHEAFQILQGRLRQQGKDPEGWITTTPKGYNWVYTEFGVERREDYRMVVCSARENPFLTSDFVRRLEESYADDFAMQEIEGRFVVVGGKAFFQIARLQDFLEDVTPPRETRLAGLVSIWREPVVAGRYVAGGDLAWGTTGDYSSLTILDWQTGDQVAAIHGRLSLDEMALETVNLCREYNEAFVGVENNGADDEGPYACQKMVDLGYGKRMFWQDGETKEPKRPGWNTNGQTRPVMLAELEEAVRHNQTRPRSREDVGEMSSFIRNEKGRPEASAGSHDDRVMSWAIAWQMRKHAHFGMIGKREPVSLGRRW